MPSTLTLQTRRPLLSGHEIPVFGLGVFKMENSEDGKKAIIHALQNGYRHIDTASAYKNEEVVGAAIDESGVPREEIFLTTKVWLNQMGAEKTPLALEESLSRLGMDYVDLYLIHWPDDTTLEGCWKAMQRLRDQGKTRSIGVSNFTIKRFENFFRFTDEVPTVNQIEIHTFHQRREITEYCNALGILMEAYCPLARAARLDDPVLQSIASECDKTAAQVMLRWCLQSGLVTIPKSQRPSRIDENAAVFDFELSDDQMERIRGLDDGFLASNWVPDHETWY